LPGDETHSENEEETMPEVVKLHPPIDNGVTPTDPNFTGGVLVCLCSSRPVKQQFTPLALV
jgi:hypothetical protein